MLAELTIAAARRTERALGSAAALVVIGAALETAEGEARRTLLLAALGAATRAGDRGAFASLAARWASAGGEGSEKRGVSLVARLTRAGSPSAARELAIAELQRHRSAEALFTLATLGDDADLFREAAARATGTDLGVRALRAALHDAGPEHADEAELALAASTDARDVMRLAPTALASSRLYARVRVLDRLAELAQIPSTRTAALRIALAHADLGGASLGALERDRVRAIATHADAPSDVVAALAGAPRTSVDETAAREALMGHSPSTNTSDRASTVALRALAAVAAEQSAAALLLSALVAHPPSPAGWTAVLAGLARPTSRAAAVSCADAWIAGGVAPPRGFAVLAGALERADAPQLAERAWTQAIRANEKRARVRLGELLERRARAAYAAGDRVQARALLQRSLAIDPSPER